MARPKASAPVRHYLISYLISGQAVVTIWSFPMLDQTYFARQLMLALDRTQLSGTLTPTR